MPSQAKIEDLSSDPDARKETRERDTRKSSSKRSTATDNELRKRLEACFERMVDSLDARGDDELAEIIREDGPVMAVGLVNLTRPFGVLRTIVLALVSVIEPLLAFRRLFQALGARFVERRMARAQTQEAEQFSEHE